MFSLVFLTRVLKLGFKCVDSIIMMMMMFMKGKPHLSEILAYIRSFGLGMIFRIHEWTATRKVIVVADDVYSVFT